MPAATKTLRPPLLSMLNEVADLGGVENRRDQLTDAFPGDDDLAGLDGPTSPQHARAPDNIYTSTASSLWALSTLPRAFERSDSSDVRGEKVNAVVRLKPRHLRRCPPLQEVRLCGR